MNCRNILAGLLCLSILALSAGCASKGAEQYHPWVDLAKAKESIQKIKEKPANGMPDDIDYGNQEGDEGPRVKDLSVQKDTDNPYLKDVVNQKTFDQGAAIESEGVMLNFDNADIYEVIQVIAEVLDISYIIDPQVKGVVNIRSGKRIPNNQLYTLFKKLLNINGIDIRPEGDHYFIHMVNKPSSETMYTKDQIGKLENSSRLITQVVPVIHISSTEAQKLIEPYLSAQGTIYNLPEQNTLIIADFESKIIDGLMILKRLDISSLSALKVKLIKVEQAPLFDVKDELTEVLAALKINKKDYLGIQIMPLERVNSLLLIGYDESLMAIS
jgi:type II secretory pathway component GspD/PulD (secretin)